MYSEAEALEVSRNYFGGEELPASVFVGKYALRDNEGTLLENSPDQMHRRMARELARVEKKKFSSPYTEEFIYECFRNFGPIIPQGGPMSGIGASSYISLSNCFVVHSPEDSYGSIHCTDEWLTQISKRRGGVGLDISHIRPAGTPTTNSSRTATGVVTYCERYSNSIREVGQNGRRGALMISLSVHHPEVLDFARMKLDLTRVTGANVSIRLTDEFMRAVRDNTDYEQRWPVEGTPKIRHRVSARQVWKEIIHCAWRMAEPGLLFWDTILRESPADCYASLGFNSISVNPCAELILCRGDSCRLLLLNLFSFVKNPFTGQARFDYAEFFRYSQIAERLMDDIVDLELEAIDRILSKVNSDLEPEEIRSRERAIWQEIRDKCEKGRRTGTGITALGDCLAALGLRYGSEESLVESEKIYRTLKLGCYQASVDMAEELGPFPIWDSSLDRDCPFFRRMEGESLADVGVDCDGGQLMARMHRTGRRNIALLTTAPAGSVSIVAGPGPYFGTTSGIEPLFQASYVRRKKINLGDEDARVDFVDDKGDRWQEFTIYHPKLKVWMETTGNSDISQSPYAGACANDIDWAQRVKLQGIINRHVDHSISSTINLPEDVSEEVVATIYEKAWQDGLKGVTVYRDNCRSGVLVNHNTRKIPRTTAPKRPKSCACQVFSMKVRGEPWVVAVSFLGDDPYEVFAARGLKGVSSQRGKIIKSGKGKYCLLDEQGSILIENLTDHCHDDEEALARMTSTSLRHGADVNFVIDQLEKTKGGMIGFAKALSRALRKTRPDGEKASDKECPECGGGPLIYQEGCVTCKACGWSKCS